MHVRPDEVDSTVVLEEAAQPVAEQRPPLTEEVINNMNDDELAAMWATLWDAIRKLRVFQPVRAIMDRPEWVQNLLHFNATHRTGEAAKSESRICDSCGRSALAGAFVNSAEPSADLCGYCLVALQDCNATDYIEELNTYEAFHARPYIAGVDHALPNAEFCADVGETACKCATCGARSLRSYFRSGDKYQCPFCYTYLLNGGLTRLVEERVQCRETLCEMLETRPLTLVLVFDQINGREVSDEQRREALKEYDDAEMNLDEMPAEERLMWDAAAIEATLNDAAEGLRTDGTL